MNATIELEDELVPSESASHATRGFAERMVIRLLEKMPCGGLRLEHADGRIRYFGAPGAPVTARVVVRNDESFFKRCAFYGDIGMGEAYTDGLWDTDDIAAVISWFIENMNALKGAARSSGNLPGVNLLQIVNWFRHLRRENTVATSRRNIAEHYDLGNDFYRLWLDPSMTYSSARFESATQSLEDAQRGKYDAICRKLKLKFSDHVLEIGCGWGGFAVHAARNYGCKITGVTISEAQATYARQRVADEGLEDRIEIRIQDYRHITGRFDKIASIEMLEAVGDKFHDSFFAKCAEVMTPDGLLGVQMITVPDCRYAALSKGVDWIQKHIFPGSLLLSVGRINDVLYRTGDLFMHDLEDLGADYARTLSAWYDRFNEAQAGVRSLGFDEPFIRSWNYYLKYCEAAFATRNISVVQAIYTRPNNATLHHRFEEGRG
ncbi:MAG: cyclopropane-fatty-acyl-phospholipid synthase family protein [Luteolibacter sp.]|uniref:cyclopropane-fatty-acyl-phospholipid synthase family protein n=1 Tax=Luteolibacter sp. TaxID=1962973 RepID=UPI003265E0A9